MNNKEGVALLITLMILGTVIATSVGVTVLVTGETKITRLIDDSVFAVFAADAGYEKMLYACSGKMAEYPVSAAFTTDLGNGASYESHMSGDYGASCNSNILTSTGVYGDIKRAFEVTY